MRKKRKQEGRTAITFQTCSGARTAWRRRETGRRWLGPRRVRRGSTPCSLPTPVEVQANRFRKRSIQRGSNGKPKTKETARRQERESARPPPTIFSCSSFLSQVKTPNLGRGVFHPRFAEVYEREPRRPAAALQAGLLQPLQLWSTVAGTRNTRIATCKKEEKKQETQKINFFC